MIKCNVPEALEIKLRQGSALGVIPGHYPPPPACACTSSYPDSTNKTLRYLTEVAKERSRNGGSWGNIHAKARCLFSLTDTPTLRAHRQPPDDLGCEQLERE